MKIKSYLSSSKPYQQFLLVRPPIVVNLHSYYSFRFLVFSFHLYYLLMLASIGWLVARLWKTNLFSCCRTSIGKVIWRWNRRKFHLKVWTCNMVSWCWSWNIFILNKKPSVCISWGKRSGRPGNRWSLRLFNFHQTPSLQNNTLNDGASHLICWWCCSNKIFLWVIRRRRWRWSGPLFASSTWTPAPTGTRAWRRSTTHFLRKQKWRQIVLFQTGWQLCVLS